MAVNDLTFNDLSTVLNAIVEQATGQAQQTPVDESSFVTVAQVGLKAGYDPLMTAISQVLSRTIFSERAYAPKFKGIRTNEQRFGAITRKLQLVDSDWKTDVKFNLENGETVDHYTINKPEALQTNFYGANTFMDYVTIYTEQLDNAFSGSAQFGEFISMIMTNISNRINQAHENLARATIANFVAGHVSANNNVIYLLDEYNEETGLNLTDVTVYAPENFDSFVKWVDARIETLSSLMENRGTKFHFNVADKPVQRHTPKRMQKIYLQSALLAQIKSRTLTGAYHDNYLKIADVEGVDFWQTLESPKSVQSTPVYLDETDGSLTSPAEAVTIDNLIGVMFDEEALGYTVVKHTIANTPLNAKGLYYNMYWHFTDRYWNDFLENGIVLLLSSEGGGSGGGTEETVELFIDTSGTIEGIAQIYASIPDMIGENPISTIEELDALVEGKKVIFRGIAPFAGDDDFMLMYPINDFLLTMESIPARCYTILVPLTDNFVVAGVVEGGGSLI